MSLKQHESASHRIGFEPSASSPAPAYQGARRGYFDDTATKRLLRLSDEEVLLNSGTYGSKELGQLPIEMSFIRDGDYDQRLTPFVPRHHTYYGNQLTMHQRNGQWFPLAASIMALWNIFSEIVVDALKLAERTGLSLPSYALDLVPRLRYKISPEDSPLFFQLLPFFSPSALRARWCRIARVTILLEGYINLCTRLLHPDAEWARGIPVGIRFDANSATNEDGKLALAYRFLSTPFTAPLELIAENGYSLEDARNALLGQGYGKRVARLLFDEIDELDNTDADALDFVAINPHYNPLKYQPDGLRTTRKERDLMAAEASDDGDDYSMDWTSAPIPPLLPSTANDTSSPATRNPHPSRLSGVIMSSEPSLPTIVSRPSAEDLAQPDPAVPSSIPTPISASTSTSASAAASAYSSASSSNLHPSTGSGPNPWRAKPSNRKRRAAEFPKAARPPKRMDAGTRDWSHYFEAQVERGVEYSGQVVVPTQPQAAEGPRRANEGRRRENEHPKRDLVVAPRVAAPIPRPLLGQEKQMVFRDSDTGAMAAMPVFETSFASLGVSLSATAPRQETSSEPSSLPPQDAHDRSAPSRRNYSRRSPSPRRDHYRRSPSP